MTLDFRDDFKALSAELARRINGFSTTTNAGPGKAGDLITLITFGYECDQSGWAALVFDTRPDAAVDLCSPSASPILCRLVVCPPAHRENG